MQNSSHINYDDLSIPLRTVWVVWVTDVHGDTFELQVFSTLDNARKFYKDIEKLYNYKDHPYIISIWQRPIDIILPTARCMYKNPETGYEPKLISDTHIDSEHKCHYLNDNQFWK